MSFVQIETEGVAQTQQYGQTHAQRAKEYRDEIGKHEREFRIVGGMSEDTQTVAGQEVAGYAFGTANQGEWFYVPPDIQIPYVHDEPHGPRKDLRLRSTHDRPKEGSHGYMQKLHTDNELLYAANVNFLAPLHFSSNADSDIPQFGYRSYTEVDLNDFGIYPPLTGKKYETCGKVDVVSIAPNNHVMRIDFGSLTDKKRSLAPNNSWALAKNFYDRQNGQVPAITNYIGQWGFGEGFRYIWMHYIDTLTPEDFVHDPAESSLVVHKVGGVGKYERTAPVKIYDIAAYRSARFPQLFPQEPIQ